MYCKNCGKQVEGEKEYCEDCEKVMAEKEQTTVETPVQENTTNTDTNTKVEGEKAPELKSKMAAGLFGIFLGAFGVHNFYLGYTTKAIIQVTVTSIALLLSCCTAGLTAFIASGIGIWGLIEGILILAGSIKVDGKGNPLKD